MSKFIQQYQLVSFPTQDVTPLYIQKDNGIIFATPQYNPLLERESNRDYLHLYLLDYISKPIAGDTDIFLYGKNIKVAASTDVSLGIPTFLDDYILQAYCKFSDYLNIKYITEYPSENKVHVSYDNKIKLHPGTKEFFISDYKEFLTDRPKYKDLSVNTTNPFECKSQEEREALKAFCMYIIDENNIEELKQDYDMLPDSEELVIENNWDKPLLSKVV